MAENDKGTAGRMEQSTGPGTGLHAINISNIVTGLVADLEGLRAGTVTIPQARARSQVAHEIFRGVNLVIAGQRIIEGHAKALNALPKPQAKRGRKAATVIDGA